MADIAEVKPLTHYTEDDINDMSILLGELSDRFVGKSIDTTLLDAIISSQSHELFVAKVDGRIAGMATLSITLGPGADMKVYLEDFIVSSSVRGSGIGTALWDAVVSWSSERHADIFFTSGPKHEAAHAFYLGKGAVKRDTTVFKYTVRHS